MTHYTWNWEKVDPSRAPVSGDLAKIFKNETLKQPGVFATNAPSPNATLLAREAIQNSWDAARELASSANGPANFTIVFKFRRVVGSEKADLVERLNLTGLRERADVSERRALGLADEDALTKIDDTGEPLDLLYVEEHGTTGMYGPWTGADSKLYLALVAVGFTEKANGSGGSYGYGKAGMVRGSKLHTVIGHTHFREQANDPAVVSRLLGVAYWGQHSYAHERWTGFARLGQRDGDATKPLENYDADNLAAQLGMALREGDDPEMLGSTFLLPDPTVEPEGLVTAIERNWWPALIDRAFRVEVRDYDGSLVHVRPRKNHDLKAFIRGFEIARSQQDNQPDDEYRQNLGTYTPQGAPNTFQLGSLGMKADLAGWSYATSDHDGDGVKHESLIALVRGPRMVVEYLPCNSTQPFIRGAFIADESVDDLLRQTEPTAHDAWQIHAEEEGMVAFAPRIAKKIRDSIRAGVRDFRRRLKPPPVREQDIRLPLFDNLMKDIFESTGNSGAASPPRGDARMESIRIDQDLEEGDTAGMIRLRAKVQVELAENHDKIGKEPGIPCVVRLRYAFDEDGSVGDDCELSVDPPSGFVIDPNNTGKGILTTGILGPAAAVFKVMTAEYPADWSGRLIVTTDLGKVTDSDKTSEGSSDVK